MGWVRKDVRIGGDGEGDVYTGGGGDGQADGCTTRSLKCEVSMALLGWSIPKRPGYLDGICFFMYDCGVLVWMVFTTFKGWIQGDGEGGFHGWREGDVGYVAYVSDG